MILRRLALVREAGRLAGRATPSIFVALCVAGLAFAEETNALPKSIIVVDSEGRPIADADVSSSHWYTVKQEGKTYRLRGPLSDSTKTDSNGVAQLSTNLAKWKDGTLAVSKHRNDDESGRTTYHKLARVEFKPGQQSIRVVAHDAIHFTGRILLEGVPAKRIEVCLTERLPDKGFFGRRVGNFCVADDEGRFELLGFRGGTFSIEVMQRLGKKTLHYYHQDVALIETATKEVFGSVKLRKDQFLGLQELLALNEKLYPKDDASTQ